MRAAVVTEARPELRIDRVDDPTPTAGEVVVRVTGCGICGSDIHLAEGLCEPGTVLGHEIDTAQGYSVRPALIGVDEADEIGLDSPAANRIVHVRSFQRAALETQLRARRRRIDTLGLWTRNRGFAQRLAGALGAATSRVNFLPGNRFRDLCDFYTRNRFPDHALVAAASSGVRRRTVMGER